MCVLFVTKYSPSSSIAGLKDLVTSAFINKHNNNVRTLSKL